MIYFSHTVIIWEKILPISGYRPQTSLFHLIFTAPEELTRKYSSHVLEKTRYRHYKTTQLAYTAYI